MALQVTLFFICAGLTGIQSITTVGHVAVEAGGTVHIPCRYEYRYVDNVKYLCRGSTWGSCSYVIKTNQENTTKYSINDDKNHGIVTFTMKKLEIKDSDHYWCSVQQSWAVDLGELFQLSVTKKGESKLHVDSQWITGYFGNQVTIYCKYSGFGLKKQWCKVGGLCVSTSGKIDGALVTTDASVPGLFAVTMTGLWQQNAGWYWCSVGDLQMPVFLDVAVRSPTITLSTATMESNPTLQNSVLAYTIVKIVALCLLILTTVVAFLYTKSKMTKTEAEVSSPEIGPAEGRVSYINFSYSPDGAEGHSGV